MGITSGATVYQIKGTDDSIPALIKPWGSEQYPPQSPFVMMNHIGGSNICELDRLNDNNLQLLPVLHPLLKNDNSPKIGEGVCFDDFFSSAVCLSICFLCTMGSSIIDITHGRGGICTKGDVTLYCHLVKWVTRGRKGSKISKNG